MMNVTQSIKGTILTIQVDLSKTFGPSASGKTTMIASTQGNQKLPAPHDQVSFGLNVYTKAAQV
jgi:hypothetical protein